MVRSNYGTSAKSIRRATLSELLTDGSTDDLFNGIYATERPNESINQCMNFMMNVLIGGASLIAFSILFALTALTVEKNYFVISLLKVMGYQKREVRSMILNSYFIYALISALLSIPIALLTLRVIIVIFAEGYGLVLPSHLNSNGSISFIRSALSFSSSS